MCAFMFLCRVKSKTHSFIAIAGLSPGFLALVNPSPCKGIPPRGASFKKRRVLVKKKQTQGQELCRKMGKKTKLILQKFGSPRSTDNQEWVANAIIAARLSCRWPWACRQTCQ
jgi:hypothetical protein